MKYLIHAARAFKDTFHVFVYKIRYTNGISPYGNTALYSSGLIKTWLGTRYRSRNTVNAALLDTCCIPLARGYKPFPAGMPERTLCVRKKASNAFTLVYKIPYRRARAWPSARASKGILHTTFAFEYGMTSSDDHACMLLKPSKECLVWKLNWPFSLYAQVGTLTYLNSSSNQMHFAREIGRWLG